MARVVTGVIIGTATAALAASWAGFPAVGQERDCKDERIQAAGSASVLGKGRAQQSAITNWQREVRNRFGERYMQWDRAREKRDECESASVGALGKFNQRCMVAAVPCASGTLTPDEDRVRDRDRGAYRYEPEGHRELYEREIDRERRADERARDDDSPSDKASTRQVQRLLNRWGYPVATDGVWDDDSRMALKRFQKRMGLEADGEPGPRTIAALRGQLNRDR